jgi:hypothetical protein
MSKRGRLSDEEMAFIASNLDRPDDYIADKLNRTPETITKYRNQINSKASIAPQLEKARSKYDEAKFILQSKPNWPDIKEQYSENEIKLVEYHWAMLYQQFKEDMTHTEELQLFKLINLEVMIDRNMKLKAIAERELERIESLLSDLYDRDSSNRTAKDEQVLMQLETEKVNARSAQMSRNSEYAKLLEKHNEILKGLKGTRAERIKDVESSNETFFGLIKALANDVSFRERVSQNTELYRMGVEKEMERLSAPHQYMDGGVDFPLLTPENYERQQNVDTPPET